MSHEPADNSLTILPNGIILLTQTGFQTAQSVSQFTVKTQETIEDYHRKGRKAFILVDLTKVTGHDAEARAEGLKRMKGNYDAMAVCGNNAALRLVVNWLIRMTDTGQKVQFFATYDEALHWLQDQM